MHSCCGMPCKTSQTVNTLAVDHTILVKVLVVIGREVAC